MSSPRRPGSSSRRRVAGQRNRSSSNGSSTRIGLSRPADSADAVEEQGEATSQDEAADQSTQDETAADSTGTDADATSKSTTAAASASGAVSTGKAGRAKRNGTTHEPTPTAGQDSAGQEQDQVFSYQPDVEPSAESDVAQGDDRTGQGSADEVSDPAAGRPGGTKNLVTAMVAATVVLAGLATWFGIEAYAANNGNRALSDQATTSEVNGQITDGVEKIFSYDFADTGKTERAAKDLLTGGAVGEYDQLFTTVKQQAPIQKLVVTTTVKASSVTRLEGDRAEVLLFVDQNATRTDVGGQPSVGPAQVVINAEKHGDQWKISHITQR